MLPVHNSSTYIRCNFQVTCFLIFDKFRHFLVQTTLCNTAYLLINIHDYEAVTLFLVDHGEEDDLSKIGHWLLIYNLDVTGMLCYSSLWCLHHKYVSRALCTW